MGCLGIVIIVWAVLTALPWWAWLVVIAIMAGLGQRR